MKLATLLLLACGMAVAQYSPPVSPKGLHGTIQGSGGGFVPSPQTLQGITIVCWGDSICAGNEDGTGNTWPLYLANYLGATVINAGVGGQTSTQIAARFAAAPQYYSACNIIEAGRNNYTAGSTVLADIAGMVALMPPPRCFVVVSILNGTSEYYGTTNYNTILALNASLQAAYPNNYLDLRTALVSAANFSNYEDAEDHSGDNTPSSLRALEVQGTVGAITTTSTCSFTTSVAVGNNEEIVFGTATSPGEKILITGVSGGTTVTACTRGYFGTTPATYTSGTNFSEIDALHPGYNGYQLFAVQTAAWFTNPNAVNTPAVVGSSGLYTGTYIPFRASPGIFSNLVTSTITGPPGVYGVNVIGQSGLSNPAGSLPGALNLFAGNGATDNTCEAYWNTAKNATLPIAAICMSPGGAGSLLHFWTSGNYGNGIGQDSFNVSPTQIYTPVGAQFAGLATTGTIGGSVCSTSAGVILYEANIPCTPFTVLHSNFTDSNTTFTTVSDGTKSWSWPVAASTDYYLDCTLTYEGATATSNSPNFQITGPATSTSLFYTVEGYNGTTFVSATAASFSTSLNPFSTLASDTAVYTAHIYMGLSNGTNAGTVVVQAKNTTGTDVLTIYAGSTCRLD